MDYLYRDDRPRSGCTRGVVGQVQNGDVMVIPRVPKETPVSRHFELVNASVIEMLPCVDTKCCARFDLIDEIRALRTSVGTCVEARDQRVNELTIEQRQDITSHRDDRSQCLTRWPALHSPGRHTRSLSSASSS